MLTVILTTVLITVEQSTIQLFKYLRVQLPTNARIGASSTHTSMAGEFLGITTIAETQMDQASHGVIQQHTVEDGPTVTSDIVRSVTKVFETSTNLCRRLQRR